MEEMERAIIERLLENVSIQSFVANRIFPLEREQRSGLPAITVRVVSGNPIYTDDGDTGLQNDRVQIDCFAEEYKTVKQIERAVMGSLSAFFGVQSGVEFATVLLDDRRDFQEPGHNVSSYPKRRSLDFIVWYYADYEAA